MQITEESDFSDETKEKADELLEILDDPHFNALLHFQTDVLSIATSQSLHYQEEAGTHIGEYEIQLQLTKSFEKLKELKGTHFKQFLLEAKCTDDEEAMENYVSSGGETDIPSCKTLQRFESCQYKVYRFKPLKSSSTKYQPLSSYFKGYIDKLLEFQHQYFTHESDRMKLFDTLAPFKWRKRMPTGEEESIYKLGLMFKIPNARKLRTLWPIFRKEITDSELFCISKTDANSKPQLFWANILNCETLDIPFEIRMLLEHILVVPIGSGDAGKISTQILICTLCIFYSILERAFSVLNGIRGKTRTRMTPEHVNDELTIKINGKKYLDMISQLYYM